jgi:hypothetical protein
VEIFTFLITILVFGFIGALIVLKVKKKTSVANIIIYSALAVMFLLFDSSTKLFAIYNFEIMINHIMGSIMIGAVVGAVILLRREKLKKDTLNN